MMKNKLKSNKKKVENLGSNTHFPRSTPHLFSVKSLTEKKICWRDRVQYYAIFKTAAVLYSPKKLVAR